MRVRAIQLGYYGMQRREEGEVFELKPTKALNKKTGLMEVVSVEQQFSNKWMERVTEESKTRRGVKPQEKSEEPVVEKPSGDEEVL